MTTHKFGNQVALPRGQCRGTIRVLTYLGQYVINAVAMLHTWRSSVQPPTDTVCLDNSHLSNSFHHALHDLGHLYPFWHLSTYCPSV
jgi:hypothetical protein